MPTVAIRGPRRAAHVPDLPEVAALVALGRAHGLDAVGVAAAEPFATTRRHLERRRAAGMHGGMAFTYRRPERSTEPRRALPDARAIVVGARGYLQDSCDDAEDDAERGTERGTGRPQGRVARYAREDHYATLRAALGAIADELKAAGWRTRVVADDNALVDREAAYRAGLGWYGKNSNLLLPGRGSWFVLGSVITDAPLAASDERVEDGCGGCTRCLDGCPTGAIVAPGVVDARRCLAWLLQDDGPFPHEYRTILGDRIYGCDDCQEVCPPNRRAGAGAGPDGSAVGGGTADADGAAAGPTADLLDMLAATDEELLARYGRWYVPRRQARYLRRNALVVLGNVGDPGDAATLAALARALGDPDPVVRGHAVWAARRLGRDDLLAPVAADGDPLVRAELEAPVEPIVARRGSSP